MDLLPPLLKKDARSPMLRKKFLSKNARAWDGRAGGKLLPPSPYVRTARAGNLTVKYLQIWRAARAQHVAALVQFGHVLVNCHTCFR